MVMRKRPAEDTDKAGPATPRHWFTTAKGAAFVHVFRVLRDSNGAPRSRKLTATPLALADPLLLNEQNFAEGVGPGRFRLQTYGHDNKLCGAPFQIDLPDPAGRVPMGEADDGDGGDDRELTVRDFLRVQKEGYEHVIAIQAECSKQIAAAQAAVVASLKEERRADLAAHSGIVEHVIKTFQASAGDGAAKDARKENQRLTDRLLEVEKKLARKEGDWAQIAQLGGSFLDKLKPAAPPADGALTGAVVSAADVAAGGAPADPKPLPSPADLSAFLDGGGALTFENISDLADRFAAGTLPAEYQPIVIPHVLGRYRAGQLPAALAAKLRPLAEAAGAAGAPS